MQLKAEDIESLGWEPIGENEYHLWIGDIEWELDHATNDMWRISNSNDSIMWFNITSKQEFQQLLDMIPGFKTYNAFDPLKMPELLTIVGPNGDRKDIRRIENYAEITSVKKRAFLYEEDFTPEEWELISERIKVHNKA